MENTSPENCIREGRCRSELPDRVFLQITRGVLMSCILFTTATNTEASSMLRGGTSLNIVMIYRAA